MELNAWQKIGHRLLGGLLRKRARGNKELSNDIQRGNLAVMPEVFMATSILSTIATVGILVGLNVLIFMPGIGGVAIYENIQDPVSIPLCVDWAYWHSDEIDYNLNWGVNSDEFGEVQYGGCPYYQTKSFPAALKLIIPILTLGLGPLLAYKTYMGGAKRAAEMRSKDIEKYLPYAASYTAAMSAANATPQKIFRSLSKNQDIYGEIAHDSAQIFRDTNLLGFDLVTAIKMSVGRAASPWLTEFFQGMEGTLTAGGNLKIYFLNRAEHYMRENRTRLHVFLETLAMLAESYVVVAVAMPLFLLVMLVIMFWVSGSGSTMDESTLYFIVLGFLPMIHIAYGYLVWAMSADQNM